MSPTVALDALDALLDAERAAIRAVDANRVLELADEKASLVEALRAADWANARDEVHRFRALVPKLRENGVLLAHARNSARDLVQALAAERPATYGASGVAAPAVRGARLSVEA